MSGVISASIASVVPYFSPLVATGGTISTTTLSGIPYKVHTFTSNGTFSVSDRGTTAGKVKILLVAGGGGSGKGEIDYYGEADNPQFQGAGGAGGVIDISLATASLGSNAITVGSSGTASTGYNGPTASTPRAAGTNGTNSTGLGQTALGGGTGGMIYNTLSSYSDPSGSPVVEFPAGNGGSGGGSYATGSYSQSAGFGTSGQGYNGMVGFLHNDGTGNIWAVAGSGGGASSSGSTPLVNAVVGVSQFYYGQGGTPYTSLFGTNYGRGGYSTLQPFVFYSLTLPTVPTSAYGNGQDQYVPSALGGSNDGVVIVYYPINRNLV
jgi:hypothetical protein